MRKRRTSGRVTLQDVADYVGVGIMTVSRAMRTPERVSARVRQQVETAASQLGYQASPPAGEPHAGASGERVTLQDVARYAGVGPMTVSRALRDPTLVSDASLQKIRQAVAATGYVPLQAAALASSRLHTVAVLYPFQHDRASNRFIQALQQTLNRQPFQLIMACHEYHQYGETPLVQTLLQSRPSALVLFGAQLSDKTCALIAQSDLVTVNVCGAERFPADITLDMAIGDAAERLTRHLLEKGYRRIAFIGAHTDNRLHRQQLNGWHKAMLAHYQNADLMITVPEAPSLQQGRYALSQLLQNQPDLDAVICSHEELAFGVLAECQRRLMKVPYDLAVACLDGSDNCDHTFPALTSMRLNYEQLGQQVGEQLMAMLDNAPPAREEQLKFTLEPGASS